MEQHGGDDVWHSGARDRLPQTLSGNVARVTLTHVRDMLFISQGGAHVKVALPHVSASKSAGLALGMSSIIRDSSCFVAKPDVFDHQLVQPVAHLLIVTG